MKNYVPWVVMAVLSLGQAADSQTKVEFEVAAIRPAKDDGNHQSNSDRNLLVIHNFTLKRLIARAYDVDIRMISGGPKWVDSDSFDINAKIPENYAQQTREMMPLMMQSLLADRFQLVLHRESGQILGYALVVAKNGPKMERVDDNADGPKLRSRNRHLTADAVSMLDFAKDLSRNSDLGKLVVDRTGLAGRYKFELDWVPDRVAEVPESSAVDGQPILAALVSQLGLRLEAAKVPVSTIVIDRVERPDAN